MRTFGKWLGRALLALVLAAVVIGLWKREQIMRLMAVNSLFAEERIVGNFSNMDAAFLTTPVSRGDGPVAELQRTENVALPDGAEDWIARRQVTSLLAAKDGIIRHEAYFLGTDDMDRRISWSVAKSYLSALFGVLHANGTIPDLDAPVTDYVPALAGGAYDGATIRNVLQMSSGITFDEDYLDYDSDINRMGRVLALGGAMDGFASELTETFQPAGAAFKYTSIDTHVLAMVVRAAAGRPLAELLSEHIVSKLGLERDGLYITDGEGVAFALGGLNFTTRDYARFGMMIEQDGLWQGRQIVPADWIAESTEASARTEPGKIGYGYQWWIPIGAAENEFLGRGIYGQYLYIDQDRDVVIVMTAADRKFREEGVEAENTAMFRAIARQL